MGLQFTASPPHLALRTERGGPLTVTQQQLLMLDREISSGNVLNMSYAVAVDGPLNLSALEGALRDLAGRHEPLRSVHFTTHGVARSVVRGEELFLCGVDLKPKAVGNLTEGAVLAIEERDKKFDIARETPMRTVVLELPGGRHVLLLTFHHICVDGWSLSVLCRDVSRLYSARIRNQAATLAPMAAQCIEQAQWQKDWLMSDKAEREMQWWMGKLHALPSARLFPGEQSFQLDGEIFRQVLALPKELMDELGKFARRTPVSLYALLLAGFNVLVSHWTRCTDVVIGSLVANRPTAASSYILGAHYNVILIRTDLSGEQTLAEVILRTKESTESTLDHQSLPYAVLAQKIGWNFDSKPLPEVMFQFDNYPLKQLSLEGTQITGLYFDNLGLLEGEASLGKMHAVTTADLTFFVREMSGHFTVSALYRRGSIQDGRILGLLRSYVGILTAMVDRPETPLDELQQFSSEDCIRDASLVTGQSSVPGLRPVTFLSPVEALSPVSPRLPNGTIAIGACP